MVCEGESVVCEEKRVGCVRESVVCEGERR